MSLIINALWWIAAIELAFIAPFLIGGFIRAWREIVLGEEIRPWN